MHRIPRIDHGRRTGRNHLVGHRIAMLHILGLGTYPCGPDCNRDNHHSAADKGCYNKDSSKDACQDIVGGDEVDAAIVSRALELAVCLQDQTLALQSCIGSESQILCLRE